MYIKKYFINDSITTTIIIIMDIITCYQTHPKFSHPLETSDNTVHINMYFLSEKKNECKHYIAVSPIMRTNAM